MSTASPTGSAGGCPHWANCAVPVHKQDLPLPSVQRRVPSLSMEVHIGTTWGRPFGSIWGNLPCAYPLSQKSHLLEFMLQKNVSKHINSNKKVLNKTQISTVKNLGKIQVSSKRLIKYCAASDEQEGCAPAGEDGQGVVLVKKATAKTVGSLFVCNCRSVRALIFLFAQRQIPKK